MSRNGSISVEIRDHIGTIEFHHPKGNSLPGDLLRELAKKITEIGNNVEVNVIIVQSKGEGAFCGGASFDELTRIETHEQGKHFFMGFALVLNAMRTCPKLIIVRVQGKAVGGGVGIAAAGDYTIAHESASVKLSELALGIGPFVVGPAVQRRIGTSAFSSLAINATTWHDASWAKAKGLYSSVHEKQEKLDEEVKHLTDELANSSLEAMQELKKMLWAGTEEWESLLGKRAEISGKLVLSDYTKNFIAKFRQSAGEEDS